MNQNQSEQKARLIQRANEYRQKTSNTMYVISFLFGILIIIASYTVLKAITDFMGLWTTILIIAIISILAARKL